MEFFTPLLNKRNADQSTTFSSHEIDHFRSDISCSREKVSFVLTILVVDNDQELSGSDILNGFFFGDWVDGVYGEDTMITLSYQTIRTKSWNNRWLIEQWWGEWVAQREIYAAFWAIDGVLATLDAAGTI